MGYTSVRVDSERGLYVLTHLDAECKPVGVTCLGFAEAWRQAANVAAWLGESVPSALLFEGDKVLEGFAVYQDLKARGEQYHKDTGRCCLADLTPCLIGLEGRRVEVVTEDGETRRFWVSRSAGWMPCHIEVMRRGSAGGEGADVNYKSVRVVR